MALLPGASPEVIQANVYELIRQGYSPANALLYAKRLAEKHRRDLLASGKKKVPKKVAPTLPRQIPPKLIEGEYAKRIVSLIIDPLYKAYAPVVSAVREKTREAKLAEAARTDALSEGEIRQLLIKAAAKLGQTLDYVKLTELADKYAKQVSAYQKTQLKKQISAAIGTDPTFGDKRLASRIGTFVKENVSLVKRIPERLHGELSDLIEQGAREAWLTPDLAEAITTRFGIAERHARLIARDQVGSLYADVNHDRQRSLGVTRFVWRTVHDERVRGDPDGLYPKALPSHFDLDGMLFDYDDPPQPDGADEPILPGDQISCRCYAEPVLDDIVDDDDEGDDEDENTVEFTPGVEEGDLPDGYDYEDIPPEEDEEGEEEE